MGLMGQTGVRGAGGWACLSQPSAAANRRLAR